MYRNLHSYTTEDMKKVKQGYDWVMEKCQEFEKAPKSLVGADITKIMPIIRS